MTEFTSLRQVDQALGEAYKLHASLKLLGYESELKKLEPDFRYLKMRGVLVNGGCYDVLLDIFSWGYQCYP